MEGRRIWNKPWSLDLRLPLQKLRCKERKRDQTMIDYTTICHVVSGKWSNRRTIRFIYGCSDEGQRPEVGYIELGIR